MTEESTPEVTEPTDLDRQRFRKLIQLGALACLASLVVGGVGGYLVWEANAGKRIPYALLLAAAPSLLAQVDARMLRQPDVSQTHISFVYAGDIWIVPKQGGTAQRLSSPRGEESFPRFSPDGSNVAYWTGTEGFRPWVASPYG